MITFGGPRSSAVTSQWQRAQPQTGAMLIV
jgi:hypothetical protein